MAKEKSISPLTVAIIIGFQYKSITDRQTTRTLNNLELNGNVIDSPILSSRAAGEERNQAVDNESEKDDLPGIIIDMYQAYEFSRKFNPQRIVVITDVEKDNKWYEYYSTFRRNIADISILTFIQKQQENGTYYRYENREKLCDLISTISKGAERLFFYYTGHGQQGGIQLPTIFPDEDIDPADNMVTKSEPKNVHQLLPITLMVDQNRPIDNVPSEDTVNYSLIPTFHSIISPLPTNINSISSSPEMDQSSKSAPHIELCMVSENPSSNYDLYPIPTSNYDLYPILPSTHDVHPVPAYSWAGSLHISSNFTTDFPSDSTSSSPSPSQIQNSPRSPSPSQIQNSPRSSIFESFQTVSKVSSRKEYKVDRMKPGGWKEEQNNNLLMDQIREMIFNNVELNAECIFIFDCCHGADMNFPFTLRPDGMMILAHTIPKDLLLHRSTQELQKNIKKTTDIKFYPVQAICISSAEHLQRSLSTSNGSLFTRYLFTALNRKLRSLAKIRKEVEDNIKRDNINKNRRRPIFSSYDRHSTRPIFQPRSSLTSNRRGNVIPPRYCQRLNNNQRPSEKKEGEASPSRREGEATPSRREGEASPSRREEIERDNTHRTVNYTGEIQRSTDRIRWAANYLTATNTSLANPLMRMGDNLTQAANKSLGQDMTIYATYPDLIYLWPWLFNMEQQYRIVVDKYHGLLELLPISDVK